MQPGKRWFRRQKSGALMKFEHSGVGNRRGDNQTIRQSDNRSGRFPMSHPFSSLIVRLSGCLIVFSAQPAMSYSSYSDFLRTLEAAGELVRVAAPVATELEITEWADREMKSPAGGRALLFEKPTVHGKPSRFPLAINTLGSERRMAMSLGLENIEQLAREMELLLKAKPPTNLRAAWRLALQGLGLLNAKPRHVAEGACQEVVHRFVPAGWQLGDPVPLAPAAGDLPTLLDLPILHCWPNDGGRFITFPCVHTVDPDTGERNLGMYRMQIYDGQTAGMHWQVHKVGARH